MFVYFAALIGFGFGFWFEMTPAGYMTLAFISAGFMAAEIIHVKTTEERASAEQKRVVITMVPLVIGLVLVAFMLLGAITRMIIRTF
jgi:ABC-type amino acid transport system permease subunit